jgi:Tol biopolymer transport system component
MAWIHKTMCQWLVAGGAILFCANAAVSQSNYDIYKVDVKTGAVSQLTNIPDAEEYNPSWEPGARRIAHDVKGGSAPLGHSIYITKISTGVSKLLTGAEGGNDAAWSPDGDEIAFDRDPVGDPSIYLVCAPNGGVPKLLRNDAVDADWAPNSKRLVFRQPSDGSIRTIHKNGRAEIFVAYGERPVWSPDGRYIAFGSGGDIWTVRVNHSGEPVKPPVQLVGDVSFDGSPSWSKDNETIVFHSDRGGDFDIWTVPACGGVPTKLAGLAGYGDYDPSFAKNRFFVAYAGFTAPAASKANFLIADESSRPSTFNLEQNYPNPFNPETEIRFQIPEATHVVLIIYNMLGQEIRTLINADYELGPHSAHWDGKDNQGQVMASGVYLYRLQAGSFLKTKKMNLLR